MRSVKNIIVVGASAGGFKAVVKLVSGFKNDMNAAVFIVLHMSRKSIPHVLAQHLAKHTDLICAIPEDKEPIRRGHIYVSPADSHMLIRRDIIRITNGPHENLYRPSIDVLFRSAAAAYGSSVIGIVLTGMLDDGTSGMSAIKRSGGVCIVQEPAEAEFPEMPKNVLKNIEVDYQVPISDIGYILDDLFSKPNKQQEAPDEVKIEAQITERMASSIDNLKKIADHSDYVCPDCGGGLWEIRNDKTHRYRCHTGHVYNEEVLVQAQAENLEESLWVSIRMLEERKNLLRSVASHAHESGDLDQEAVQTQRADDINTHIERLKSVLITLNKKDILFNPGP